MYQDEVTMFEICKTLQLPLNQLVILLTRNDVVQNKDEKSAQTSSLFHSNKEFKN